MRLIYYSCRLVLKSICYSEIEILLPRTLGSTVTVKPLQKLYDVDLVWKNKLQCAYAF